eukprot:jgi/Botrbrau1/17379/Bobra.0494s0004.1
MTLLAGFATVKKMCSNLSHSRERMMAAGCPTSPFAADNAPRVVPLPPSISILDPHLPAGVPMPVLLEGVGCLGRPCCPLRFRGGDVAIVGRHYSVRNGLDAVLTAARQQVLREPAFPTPVPCQERRRADLRLHAWEEGRDLYIDIVGSSPLTVANLQHFETGGAAARAAQDKQTGYAALLSRQQPPVAFQAFTFETFWRVAC